MADDLSIVCPSSDLDLRELVAWKHDTDAATVAAAAKITECNNSGTLYVPIFRLVLSVPCQSIAMVDS